jgi:hypothetical protein
MSRERRGGARLRLGLDCWVRQGYPAEAYARAQLFDLSESGTALYVEGPVPSRLAIALKLECSRYLHLTARVAWHRLCNGRILVGLCFEACEVLPELGRWLACQVGHRRASRGFAA